MNREWGDCIETVTLHYSPLTTPLRGRDAKRIWRSMTETTSDLIATRPSGLPQPRRYPGINWIGVQTLYLREVRRFWKVGAQTVAAPVVTTLLLSLIHI